MEFFKLPQSPVNSRTHRNWSRFGALSDMHALSSKRKERRLCLLQVLLPFQNSSIQYKVTRLLSPRILNSTTSSFVQIFKEEANDRRTNSGSGEPESNPGPASDQMCDFGEGHI